MWISVSISLDGVRKTGSNMNLLPIEILVKDGGRCKDKHQGNNCHHLTEFGKMELIYTSLGIHWCVKLIQFRLTRNWKWNEERKQLKTFPKCKKSTTVSAAIQLKHRTLHATATTPSFLRERINICISTYHHCTSITLSKGNIGRTLLPISVNKNPFKLKQFTILHTDQAQQINICWNWLYMWLNVYFNDF